VELLLWRNSVALCSMHLYTLFSGVVRSRSWAIPFHYHLVGGLEE
jgi:hypothetical protein